MPPRLLVAAIAVLLFANASYAGLNPKSIDSISLRIVQNGELVVTGDVQRANLTLYIPQELIDVSVSSNAEMSWRYSRDSMNNRVVVMEWNRPSNTVTYRVETIVENRAKFTNPADIGSDPKYLNETKSIVISSEIRQLAYPYEKSWENVARLTQLVYDMVEYDIGLSGARKPSDWVLENRRGVCVEHANLLTALLRASGIPTRYVVGYAYSSVDEKLIGHTWVEVAASDGTWVPFDPTWLEGGYLDATHIKTANLLDDSQIEVLTYTGDGKITWRRKGDTLETSRSLTGDLYGDSVEILGYTQRNMTSISLSSQKIPKNGYGYMRAVVKPEACLISQVRITPCVDATGKEPLQLFDRERKFFSCSPKELYWFFKEAGAGNYACPVSVHDQADSSASIDIETTARAAGNHVSISGPDTAGVNERFTLRAQAGTDFIFYSPDFGRSRDDEWTLAASRPSSHSFYLYEDGRLATKTVDVIAKKEFDLAVTAPEKVNASGNLTVDVRMKNLGAARSALLVVEFGSGKIQESLRFGTLEQKNASASFAAAEPGWKEATASLQADTLTTYSAFVLVEEQKSASFIDEFIGAVLGVLKGIKEFFAGIFVK